MDYQMDERWKLSKDGKNKAAAVAAAACMSRSGSKKKALFNLSRSFSQKSGGNGKASSSLHRSSSQRCSEFSRMAKEQKAKFYIVKRCISMLVSWKKHGGSDS